MRLFWVLTFALVLTSLAWLSQGVFHQTWCVLLPITWTLGAYISLLLALSPLLYAGSLWHQRKVGALSIVTPPNTLIMLSFFVILSLLYGWIFSGSALSYPLHIYGDVGFHTNRVILMAQDYHVWINYLFHNGQRPEFHAEYMMYPSVSYLPVTLISTLLGDVTSLSYHRFALLLYYVATVVASYLFARIILTSTSQRILLTLTTLTSALLLSYTMSYYIEMPYICILLFSFSLLAFGMKTKTPAFVLSAMFLASLAPIMRETAIPSTAGIVIAAALWRITTYPTARIRAWGAAIVYCIVGLGPFIEYYIGKSHYTNWDKERTSLSFIWQQNYLAHFTYAFLYLGFFCFVALAFFIFSKKRFNQFPFLILAAIIGIAGSLISESIFIPSYMPWSRNYLFFYADFFVLTTICLAHFRAKSIMTSLVALQVIMNIITCMVFLPKAELFHESETVFDIRPIVHYLESQSNTHEKLFAYWPKGYPLEPKQLLPHFSGIERIALQGDESHFVSFTSVTAAAPHEAHYILFYYFANNSQPKAFRQIPRSPYPSAAELRDYRILINSKDPWAPQQSGVMLLEKIS